MRERARDQRGDCQRGQQGALRSHELGVEFDGVVAQLGDGDGLETLRSLGEVGITLDPSARSRNIVSVILAHHSAL